ncbi:hypothetical protein [Flavobacterium rhizosphaerae]|uniref:hypothetical protein n=1 Tax=Flavobacterium rhizosphaerae TaxID=3163298 RepID=UPI0038B4A40C
MPLLLSAFLTVLLFSCQSDNEDDYDEIITQIESPVVMDLAQVPYPNLSDYHFFEGELKNLQPASRVIPYDLNSTLFTDYAKKKRFVWMPDGLKATYAADGETLNFPVGTALLKTFYYDSTTDDDVPNIIETRVMIKKESGWMFANYVWNQDKTEATLNTMQQEVRVSWMHNGEERMARYKIPATASCIMCHDLNDVATTIGTKPQNLNKQYNYADGTENQLSKWMATGYLNTVPQNITSTVNWTDETQPLELRVRSYLDINCAHCHNPGAYCGYTPMNFQFGVTDLPQNLGVCNEPVDFVTSGQEYIVDGQDIENSLLHYRMNNNIQSEMMPPIGRSVVDEEALQMIAEWISTMETQCP